MNFRPSKPLIALAAVLASLLAVPALSEAEYYVPPANPAANQYTQSIPSAGGEKGGGDKHKPTPAQALGAGNAQALEEQGRDGREAALVAAETAPVTAPAGGASGNGGEGGNAKDKSRGDSSGGGHASAQGGGTGGSAGGGGSGEASTGSPSGSSGVGEVVSQATGAADSGSLGLWLPFAVLAILAGCIAYRWRLRGRPTA